MTLPYRFLPVLLSGLLTLSVARPLAAQPAGGLDPAILGQLDQLPSDWRFGMNLFHMLLEQKGVRTVGSFDDVLQSRSAESVIVLCGNLRLPANRWHDLREFLADGGALLVATDRREFLSGLCLVQDGPVTTLRPALQYQGFQDCLRVTQIDPHHPLMSNVHELITNRSGFISQTSSSRGDWNVVARLPVESNNDAGRGGGSPLVATMALRNNALGRLLVVADHSLLINEMLWHGDNARFAVNTVDWLCESRRRRMLLMIDGEVVKSPFAMPEPPQPPPASEPPPVPPEPPLPPPDEFPDLPPEQWVEFGNAFVTGLEDADLFNDLVAGRPRDLHPALYRQAILLSLAALAGLWFLRRVVLTRRRFDRPPVRSTASPLDDRVEELLSADDLRPAAGHLARHLLSELTGSDNPREWSVMEHELQVDADPFQRNAVRTGFDRIRRLATKVDRTPLTRRDFNRLTKQIDQIRTLYQQGRLHHPWFA